LFSGYLTDILNVSMSAVLLRLHDAAQPVSRLV
jgi:hypothetical protein